MLILFSRFIGYVMLYDVDDMFKHVWNAVTYWNI